jgi:hypothetical protein
MTKLRFMLVAAVAAATLTFTPGCKAPSGAANEVPRSVRVVSSIAETAAYFGTVKRLQDHPGEREIFNVAVLALQRLVDQQNYDPIAFAEALKGLPMNELSGPDGDIYISTIVGVWDAFLQDTIALDQSTVVGPVISKVLSGMRRGIDRAGTAK